MNPEKRFCRVILGAVIFLSLTACPSQRPPRTQTEFLLGTLCTITLYDDAPEDIFRRAFKRVAEIEQRMSVNIADSDISRVNAAAGRAPVAVDRETLGLVQSGLDFSRLSGGAFNIAVGPLVTLWGIGTDNAAVPSSADITAALERIDFNRAAADSAAGALFLEEPGMALDLGAIAKGYAADEAARVLREAGVRRGIIDFGGNILVLGTRPNGMKWRVGVQNPGENRGAYIGILELSDMAVVSSGVYERFFTGGDGRRYHHILDTATGYPVQNGLTEVTVITENSRTADALSTTFFALGLPAGRDMAEKMDGVEALFITENKVIHTTSGLREFFKLTDESYTLADGAP